MDTRFFFSVSWIAPSQSDARYGIGQQRPFLMPLTRLCKAILKVFTNISDKLHICVQLFTHLTLLVEEHFVLTT